MENFRKRGSLLVTVPSLQESLSTLQVSHTHTHTLTLCGRWLGLVRNGTMLWLVGLGLCWHSVAERCRLDSVDVDPTLL